MGSTGKKEVVSKRKVLIRGDFEEKNGGVPGRVRSAKHFHLRHDGAKTITGSAKLRGQKKKHNRNTIMSRWGELQRGASVKKKLGFVGGGGVTVL